jgi:cytochrome oxidase assembly protein ShyY1
MTEADLGKGVVSVTLVPCEGEKAGSMALENVPSKGQWYSFDVARMSESVGLPPSTAACDLIQVDPSPNSSLPLKKKVRGGGGSFLCPLHAWAAADTRPGSCWPFCTQDRELLAFLHKRPGSCWPFCTRAPPPQVEDPFMNPNRNDPRGPPLTFARALPPQVEDLVKWYVMPETHLAYCVTWYGLSAAMTAGTYLRFFR